MEFEITQLTSAVDDGFDALVAVYRADLAVRDPGDPPPSRSFVAGDLFGLPPDRTRLTYVATFDGEPAGCAYATTYSEPGDEVQMAEIEIMVMPHVRRNGIATGFMARIVPALTELGQNSVIAYPCIDLFREEAIGLCTAYGLTSRQEERCSRALVADIDDDLMGRWIEDAATKAAGYRMEQWQGPSPDHLAEAWCQAAAAMEDAPLDNVEFDPHTRDVEQQRAADEAFADRDFRFYRSLVLSADGRPAGMTALFVHVERPEVAYQDDTGVLADHRGHGIGRWLKAANYRLAREAHPEISVIETYNAQSNPWMLDINIAMGFKPHHIYGAYQAPLDAVAAAVDARSR